ncbi:unnamed protein product [Caenorhabditis angaria]|uniref:Serpentine receptor class gamma n=1 Tax=Caenorhabditis angaria TaxID=860376 RepID=A0A9P1MT27_9PELO|nr:unnamed protein product [Caenorhabditis angaria]
MDLHPCLPNFSINLEIFKFLVQASYGTFAAILYIFLIFRISRKYSTNHRLFCDIFFKFYVLDAVVSLIFLLLDFSINRPLLYINQLCYIFFNNFSTPSYFLTPYITAYNYFGFSKMLTISLLSANRFTCVVFPVWHKVFWLKYNRGFCYAVFIVPVFFTWHLAISKTYFDAYSGAGLLGYTKTIEWIRTTYFKVLVSISVFIFIFTTNIWTIQQLIAFRYRLKNLEKSLILTTIITSITFLLYIIVQMIILIVSSKYLIDHLELGTFVKKFELICNDFYLISSPIALILVCPQLRGSLFRKHKLRNTVSNLPDTTF